jgi:hypothetical protein
MRLVVGSLHCCGWTEITGIRWYERDLKDFVRALIGQNLVWNRGVRRGALLFTQAGVRLKVPYGKQLATDLQEAGLGTVHELPHFRNPNTNRVIVPFLWKVDRKVLQAYCVEHKLFV